MRKSALLAFLVLASHTTAAPLHAWIASWATSVQSGAAFPTRSILNLEDQTVRERVRVSLGGPQIRIRVSNEFGSAPLVIGAATVAVPIEPASIRQGSMREVTFGGRRSVVVPAGAPVLSDAIDFPVASGTEISISLYFPKRLPANATIHEVALKRAVISPRGDHTHAETIEGGAMSTFSIAVSAVLVPTQPSEYLVVAFGDSITDGFASSVDADRSWPADLVRRLDRTTPRPRLGIVNEGIAGNRLLSDCLMVGGCSALSALARFDRDALGLPGVTHILLFEGINDIAFPGARLGGKSLADSADAPTVDDLIAAYRQLIARAHAHGVKMIGATLTPFEGADVEGFYSDSKEATRQAVNAWIRSGGDFDGVVDFDAVLRDPDHPSRVLPRFGSRDHVHPNDTGYQAMADAIDLALFK
jgi:lysophospholipase L1-like esterase